MVIAYLDSISISEASTGSQRTWSDALEWTTILAIAVWSENQRIHSALLLLAAFPMQLITSTLYLRQPRFMPVNVLKKLFLDGTVLQVQGMVEEKACEAFFALGCVDSTHVSKNSRARVHTQDVSSLVQKV
jgi:hypothetical protein